MKIEYRIIRSRKRKKTLSLKITETGSIVIQAPCRTPEREIAVFIEKKRAWLQEKLRLFGESPARHSPQDLKTGRHMLFLGVSYPLEVEDLGSQTDLFSLQGQHFVLNSRVLMHGRALIRSWYETQARAYLPGRVEYFRASWGMEPRGIRITNATSRWGSCSPRNVLSFTWRLMMAPPPVIDYVIVHELAHIHEKNHAPPFWAIVSRMMPHYKTHRVWLRENGHRLSL